MENPAWDLLLDFMCHNIRSWKPLGVHSRGHDHCVMLRANQITKYYYNNFDDRTNSITSLSALMN